MLAKYICLEISLLFLNGYAPFRYLWQFVLTIPRGFMFLEFSLNSYHCHLVHNSYGMESLGGTDFIISLLFSIYSCLRQLTIASDFATTIKPLARDF